MEGNIKVYNKVQTPLVTLKNRKARLDSTLAEKLYRSLDFKH